MSKRARVEITGTGPASNPLSRAFIGLGGNLGDRAGHLRAAARRLFALGGSPAASGLYESAPVGPSQPDYLNAVVAITTSLQPKALLDELLAIERALGRVRGERWGPRTIDLDLLAVGAARVDDGLRLPHPEITKRAFVLRPWMDLDPEFELPGGSVRTLWEALPLAERESVRLIAREWMDG